MINKKTNLRTKTPRDKENFNCVGREANEMLNNKKINQFKGNMKTYNQEMQVIIIYGRRQLEKNDHKLL